MGRSQQDHMLMLKARQGNVEAPWWNGWIHQYQRRQNHSGGHNLLQLQHLCLLSSWCNCIDKTPKNGDSTARGGRERKPPTTSGKVEKRKIFFMPQIGVEPAPPDSGVKRAITPPRLLYRRHLQSLISFSLTRERELWVAAWSITTSTPDWYSSTSSSNSGGDTPLWR